MSELFLASQPRRCHSPRTPLPLPQAEENAVSEERNRYGTLDQNHEAEKDEPPEEVRIRTLELSGMPLAAYEMFRNGPPRGHDWDDISIVTTKHHKLLFSGDTTVTWDAVEGELSCTISSCD